MFFVYHLCFWRKELRSSQTDKGDKSISTTQKSCCWNSTTPEMYRIIMDYNMGIIYDQETQTCNEPIVFKAYDREYEIFKQYAESVGRGEVWKDWSEDEACPQKDVLSDLEAKHDRTPICAIIESLLNQNQGQEESCADEFGDNHTSQTAQQVQPGTYNSLQICSSEPDWFVIQNGGNGYLITVSFDHSAGDIDLFVYDSQLNQISSSEGINNTESAKLPEEDSTYYIEVKLFEGESNTYTLIIE